MLGAELEQAVAELEAAFHMTSVVPNGAAAEVAADLKTSTVVDSEKEE